MVNIRAKGQNGEREVQAMLNEIVQRIRVEHGFPLYEDRDLPFQRNQNQSAVGGDDLTNPFQLAIEVKRQETLSLNTWWKQCVQSSMRSGGRAILIYRQSRKAWRVVMTGLIHFTPSESKYIGPTPVDIDVETFKQWFAEYYRTLLLSS